MSKNNLLSNSSSEQSDEYMKAPKVPGWTVAAAVLALAAGILCWLFTGSVNVTLSGPAHIIDFSYYNNPVKEGENSDNPLESINEMGAYCFVPAEDINKIKPNMTVWIGNAKGYVARINPEYRTYDQMYSLYQSQIENLQLKKDEVYYVVIAALSNEEAGFSRYTIVLDTITPAQYLFGGHDE